MAEWHITPDYIIEHWTDELLHLMLEKLNERKRQEMDAINRPRDDARTVSGGELFRRAKNLVKVVKKE